MYDLGALCDYSVVDRARFINAMSRAATTVAVVTTAGSAGRWGVTVSAMSSVSADPPSVLVCINEDSPVSDAIIENGVLAVNFLGESQTEVSEIFAGRHFLKRGEHLRSAAWSTLKTGAPVLNDAAAVFDCRLAKRMTFGTHLLVVGAVEDLTFASSTAPLVHHDRKYCSLALSASFLNP